MKKAVLNPKIMLYTGINAGEYAEMIFEGGCRHNANNLGGQTEITHHAAYWEWFQNEWERADIRFLSSVVMDTEGRGLFYRGNPSDVTSLRMDYITFHINWMNGKFPNAVVMHESYGKMIHQVIKEVTRKEVCNG